MASEIAHVELKVSAQVLKLAQMILTQRPPEWDVKKDFPSLHVRSSGCPPESLVIPDSGKSTKETAKEVVESMFSRLYKFPDKMEVRLDSRVHTCLLDHADECQEPVHCGCIAPDEMKTTLCSGNWGKILTA
jgi:hypothetical protein